MRDYCILARAGEGGAVGPVLEIPEQAAGCRHQGEDRLQRQLFPGMEIQPLGAKGHSSLSIVIILVFI